VGRLPDGRAVFVHRTAPGEDVRVRVVETKRRWARAELVEVVGASPERRAAPCPHYARCGGCTLQHLRYDAQLRAKGGLVVEALRRIGGVAAPEPEVIGSPQEFRYRNRVSFMLLRSPGQPVTAGVHELRRPDRVVDITDGCLLPEAGVAGVWGRLRAEWGPQARRLPSGDRLRLTLRASESGEAVLVVEGGYARGRPEELLATVPGLASIWHRPEGGELRLLGGAVAVVESWQGEEVALSGAAFLQVNRGAAALLEAHVLERLGDVAGVRVVDAYCGIGLNARRLARRGARVVGIELDPLAVAAARESAPPGAEIVQGAVEDRLPDLLPADVVIVNPPRGGLHPAVPEALRAAPPARLFYISCDPATLARDIGRLGPGFALAGLRCFDLFPQTAHVETVAELTCATTS